LGRSDTLALDRHGAAGQLERLARAEDRGLDLEDVLGGLDDQQVDAALDERARLLLELRQRLLDRRELRIGDLEQGRLTLPQRLAGRRLEPLLPTGGPLGPGEPLPRPGPARRRRRRRCR